MVAATEKCVLHTEEAWAGNWNYHQLISHKMKNISFIDHISSLEDRPQTSLWKLNKVAKMNTAHTLFVILLFTLFSSSLAEERSAYQYDGHHLKSFRTNRHHRVRRMLGSVTKCLPQLKKFSHVFTHGKLRKRFCFMIPVKYCAALD